MEVILRSIVKEPELHARWLNTLSLLEFMGTRKIARSAGGASLDETRLRHLAEEARHAQFFKMMIRRVKPDANWNYSREYLFCGFAGARYFNSLDAGVKKFLDQKEYVQKFSALEKTDLFYNYVTVLIEERAGEIYELYENILRETQSPIRLSGIIGEEERHLEDMYSGLRSLDEEFLKNLDDLRLKERTLFTRFEKSLAGAALRGLNTGSVLVS